MKYFEEYKKINDLIETSKESDARTNAIILLDKMKTDEIEFDPIINNIIRRLGLYPYMDESTSNWEDRFVFQAFKADNGGRDKVVLHREQSCVLKELLDGKDLAISAPTSFGKSFVIDAFIAIRKPKNVVIIVPTIALTDETRRRLYKKFADEYKIITMTDAHLGEKNILIFPQERALNYVSQIKEIDLLIIDEFYKASAKFDKERSPSLLKAILKLSSLSKQRYYLAPNITDLNDSLFTKGMEFKPIDFSTVFLKKEELYRSIGKSEKLKNDALISILKNYKGKSLIYAGTYSAISVISDLIKSSFDPNQSELLESFSQWLEENYSANWNLSHLVKRRCGIHNGNMHRSLSQIQIKLFDEEEGLNWLVSTSSIIEGVNTSAENVVLWSNKNGNAKINDFTYKNIIGRGGRMFKHFIGKIFILEAPPASENTQLELEMSDDVMMSISDEGQKSELTKEQLALLLAFKDDMNSLLGENVYQELKDNGMLESCKATTIRDIAIEIRDTNKWNGIGYLNSNEPNDWDRFLYNALLIKPGVWGVEYRKFISFVKILSKNWECTIPELLNELEVVDIGIDDFFKLEKKVTFDLASVFGDINELNKSINKNDSIDISSFVLKLSSAFLPKRVYQLEEYGFPRMISKKLHAIGLVNFEDPELTLESAIDQICDIYKKHEKQFSNIFSKFELYIFKHFISGVTIEKSCLTNGQFDPAVVS